MDSLSSRCLDDFEDGVHSKVGVLSRSRSNAVGLICLLHEHRVHIGIGVNSYCLNAHLLAGLDDSTSDLTTVCDEDLIEGLGERVALIVDSSSLGTD